MGGCKRPNKGRRYCSAHYSRLKNWGELRPEQPVRDQLPAGQTKDKYLHLHRPGHPNASKRGDILAHRWVMSEVLGRPLRPGEQVHHKNGDRHDNRPGNLELKLTRTHGPGQSIEDRVGDAIEVLRAHAPDLLVEWMVDREYGAAEPVR